MSKLYPPYIEGTIPAFYGDTIKVPFAMNPAVSKNEVAGFTLKIKNINTNDELITLSKENSIIEIDYDNKIIKFIIKVLTKEQKEVYEKTIQSLSLEIKTINTEIQPIETEIKNIKELLGLTDENQQTNTISNVQNSTQTAEKDKLNKQLIELENKLILTQEELQNKTSQLDNVQNNYNTSVYLIIGNSYKMQLAYIDQNNETGYYSTVGVVKYTYEPIVEISNINKDVNNQTISYNINKKQFVGEYKNEDVTEKIYSYQFNLYDLKNRLIETSGELLHNNENGTYIEEADEKKYVVCNDNYFIKRSLELYNTYNLEYIIKTVNGLTVSSGKYSIVNAATVPPSINTDPIATLDQENGRIIISMNSLAQPMLTGRFYLLRASSKDNYQVWDTVANYVFNNQIIKDWLQYDYTIEHGVTYKYALQQYNTYGVYSDRRETEEIKVEFDSMFLYDGERQLKINFNPKVSSFKVNVLESKTDTIGGKFPYFFKNGNVKYREFPISGLISYQSDNDELFMKKEDLGIAESLDKRSSTQDASGIRFAETPTTNLVSYNFDAEREFKNQVLEFLTNGKPKLFRSAPEGSFIVRLMNTSLSPNDTLGRMLHTFSSTAYEMAELNYDNLVKYNFINIKKQQNQKLYGWETIDLKDTNIDQDKNLLTKMAYSINCEDIPKGTVLTIGNTQITIGKTWQYKPDGFIEPFNILKIKFEDDIEPQGLITYSYQILGNTVFDKYREIQNADIVIEFSDDNGNHNLSEGEGAKDNILDNIIYDSIEENIIKYKYILHNFEFIRFEKQEIMDTSQPIIDIENNIQLQDYEIYIDYNDKNSNVRNDNNKIIISIEQSGQWFAENLASAASITLGRGVKAVIAARRTKIIYEEGYSLNEESST